MHGTKGWIMQDTEEDKKIFNRELIRLEQSIKDGIAKFGENKEIIVCMHFPPTNNQIKENAKFIKVMQKYNVKQCYYGHLHGEGLNDRIEGEIGKIKLKLVSADGMEFKLEKL